MNLETSNTFQSRDALTDDQFLILNPDRLGRRFDDSEQDDFADEGQSSKKKKRKKNKSLPVQLTLPALCVQNAKKSSTDQSPSQPKSPGHPAHRSKPPSKDAQDHASKKARQKRPAQPKDKSSHPRHSLTQLPPASASSNELTSIGVQPPDLQHAYLIDRQKKDLSVLSDLELESIRIRETWIQDVSPKSLRAHFGSWLKTAPLSELVAALDEPPDLNGAPVALVIASSALRVVDLCREVKPFVLSLQASGEVTKLFARHFKLTEHISHLNATKVSIGIGTPDRIAKLLAADALKLDRLRWIILDVTWTDPKDYTLIELPDSNFKTALWIGILGYSKILDKFRSGKLQIVMF